jgi:hypothetical protein
MKTSTTLEHKDSTIVEKVPVFKEIQGYRVSTEECASLFDRLEGKKSQLNDKEYREDLYNLYIGINSWVNLYHDVLHENPSVLITRIKIFGIQAAIKEANDHRLYMISEGEYGNCSPFWARYYTLEECNSIKLTSTRKIVADEFKKMLDLLGCLRRLRLSSLDYSFMYDDFLATNQRCKRWNQVEYIHWDIADNYDPTNGSLKPPSEILSEDEFDKLYPSCGEAILSELAYNFSIIFKDYEQDRSLFTLPPGSTYEGAHTYLDKFKIVLSNQQWLREHGVNIPWYPCDTRNPADCNRYVSVPKDYKTGRGVAPEPVSRQVFGYQVDSGMRKCLRKFHVDLNDQNRNRTLCSIAYKHGLATIDKSNASDSISLTLVEALTQYTPQLWDDLCACRTNFIQVDGKIVPNYRCMTMGNAVTCSLQSGIYLSGLMYCIDLWNNLPADSSRSSKDGMRRQDRHKQFTLADIGVYNDDVILPNELVDIYIYIMTKLGFTINIEKSYTHKQKYRESCGVEYYWFPGLKNSVEVTSDIFPRGTSKLALPELIGLQHKYANYPTTASFLMTVILDVFPDITTSEIGSNYSDLWLDAPVLRKKQVYDHVIRKRTAIVRTYFRNVVDECPAFTKLGAESSTDIFLQLKSVDSEITDEMMKEKLIDAWKKFVSNQHLKLTSMHVIADCCDWSTGPEGIVSEAEVHSTFTSNSSGYKLSKKDAELVELLGYLLNIGNGVEHINNSEYTKLQDTVRCRADLVGARTIHCKNSYYC